MLSQDSRRYWYDGWQATSGVSAFGAAIAYSIMHYEKVSGFDWYYNSAEFYLWIGAGAAAGFVLWLPIAWLTWEPYEITPPGLDDVDE